VLGLLRDLLNNHSRRIPAHITGTTRCTAGVWADHPQIYHRLFSFAESANIIYLTINNCSVHWRVRLQRKEKSTRYAKKGGQLEFKANSGCNMRRPVSLLGTRTRASIHHLSSARPFGSDHLFALRAPSDFTVVAQRTLPLQPGAPVAILVVGLAALILLRAPNVIVSWVRAVWRRFFNGRSGWGPGDTVKPVFASTPLKPTRETVVLTETDRRKIIEQLAQVAQIEKQRAPAVVSTPVPEASAAVSTSAPTASPAVEMEVAQAQLVEVQQQASATTTFSLKKIREEQKARRGLYAIQKFDPNDATLVPAAAGVSVGLLALSLATPLLVTVPLAAAVTYAAKKNSDVTISLRYLGSLALGVVDFAQRVNEKLELTEKVTDALVDGIENAIGPEGVQSLEPAYLAFSSVFSEESKRSGEAFLRSASSVSDAIFASIEETAVKYSVKEVVMSASAGAVQLAAVALKSAADAAKIIDVDAIIYKPSEEAEETPIPVQKTVVKPKKQEWGLDGSLIGAFGALRQEQRPLAQGKQDNDNKSSGPRPPKKQ